MRVFTGFDPNTTSIHLVGTSQIGGIVPPANDVPIEMITTTLHGDGTVTLHLPPDAADAPTIVKAKE